MSWTFKYYPTAWMEVRFRFATELIAMRTSLLSSNGSRWKEVRLFNLIEWTCIVFICLLLINHVIILHDCDWIVEVCVSIFKVYLIGTYVVMILVAFTSLVYNLFQSWWKLLNLSHYRQLLCYDPISFYLTWWK